MLTVEPAFRELGAPLEAVRSYTDANCMSCGSCLQGCPTNAGKSTLNTYIHDAWAAGKLALRADARVERVLIEDGEALVVRCDDCRRLWPITVEHLGHSRWLHDVDRDLHSCPACASAEPAPADR